MEEYRNLKKIQNRNPLEQTIALVGQATHNITYHKQMKILNPLLKDTRKASHTIKENGELLSNDNALLGRKFKSNLTIKVKSRSVSKDLFRSTSNQFKKQSFHPGLSLTRFGQGFYNQSTRGYKSGIGFNVYKKRTQPQQFRKSSTSQKSRKQVHKKFNSC